MKIQHKYLKALGTSIVSTAAAPAYNMFRISIPCDEIDRAPLRRVLLKEFSLFCEEEKINKL